MNIYTVLDYAVYSIFYALSVRYQE